MESIEKRMNGLGHTVSACDATHRSSSMNRISVATETSKQSAANEVANRLWFSQLLMRFGPSSILTEVRYYTCREMHCRTHS